MGPHQLSNGLVPSSQFPFRRQRAALLAKWPFPPRNVVTVTLTDVPIDLNPTYLALEWPPKEIELHLTAALTMRHESCGEFSRAKYYS